MNAKPGSFACEKHTASTDDREGVTPVVVHAAIGDPIVVQHPEIAALTARVDALTKERDEATAALVMFAADHDQQLKMAREGRAEAQERVARLESALRDAKQIVANYCFNNPKNFGLFGDLPEQDPMGAHALLEAITAALGTNDAKQEEQK